MGRNVSADIRGMAPAISPQAYRLSVLVRYSPWPTGDMAFNRLHAVKQTTSINSSDSALAFLSLTNPRVCVNVWFKPSLFPSFCLPTGRVKEQRLWPFRHDLFLFIIPSTTFFFFLMRWFFFFPPTHILFTPQSVMLKQYVHGMYSICSWPLQCCVITENYGSNCFLVSVSDKYRGAQSENVQGHKSLQAALMDIIHNKNFVFFHKLKSEWVLHCEMFHSGAVQFLRNLLTFLTFIIFVENKATAVNIKCKIW